MMTTHMKPGGIVVAGGRSRRLGTDKRRLQLWGDAGPTLLAHAVALLAPHCAEVIVVLNDAEAWDDLPARLVPDAYPAAGALGGVLTGLEALQQPHALVIAADAPLLRPALLTALAMHTPTTALAVQRAGRWEPFCAIYSRRCITLLRTQCTVGDLRLQHALDALQAQALDPALVMACDPHDLSFHNINHPADLAMVQQLLN